MERVCVFGLGEAGSIIASDLVGVGATVSAFDPAPVATPDGVRRFDDPRAAVKQVDMVWSITAAVDARTALEQALADLPRSVHYADFATADPTLKLDLETTANAAGLVFTDAALMAPVAGRGIRTPVVASGAAAEDFAGFARSFGMEVTVVGARAGAAATHKLVRSVFVKGLAAVLIESMSAADAAGIADDTWATIVDQVRAADEAFLVRLIEGTRRHARRRLDEMEAAVSLLDGLGVASTMAASTAESLRREIEEGSDDGAG